ncbi:BEACH domain-containing protein [Achlya hypogyna]|uniref:BEACH domain-containing protein n=1 Tax=Achlya hypogyna TaxID=1202772 RepID=A0A1V9ZGC6_ACHHY|nr:BEACH domain-containing protein [Achlya hypogyna]
MPRPSSERWSPGSSDEWEEVDLPDLQLLSRLCECRPSPRTIAESLAHWVKDHLGQRAAWLPLLRCSHAARKSSLKEKYSSNWLATEMEGAVSRNLSIVFRDDIDDASLRHLLALAYTAASTVPWRWLEILANLPQQPRHAWSFFGEHPGLQVPLARAFEFGFVLSITVSLDPIEGHTMTLWSWQEDATSCGLDVAVVKSASSTLLVCTAWNVTSTSVRQAEVDVSTGWFTLELELSKTALRCCIDGGAVLTEPCPWTPRRSKHTLSVGRSLRPAGGSPLQGRVAALRICRLTDRDECVAMDAGADAAAPSVALAKTRHLYTALHAHGGVLWSLLPLCARRILPQLPAPGLASPEQVVGDTDLVRLVCTAVAAHRATAVEALMPFQHAHRLGSFGPLWARLWAQGRVCVSPSLVSAVFAATASLVDVAAEIGPPVGLAPWLHVVFASGPWVSAGVDVVRSYLEHLEPLVVALAPTDVPPLSHWWQSLRNLQRCPATATERAALRQQLLTVLTRLVACSPTHAATSFDALHAHLAVDAASDNADVLRWCVQHPPPAAFDSASDLWVHCMGPPFPAATRAAAAEALTALCRTNGDCRLRPSVLQALALRLAALDDAAGRAAQLGDPLVLLELALVAPTLAETRRCIGLLVADSEALARRLSECHATLEAAIVHVARLGCLAQPRDAEWLAVADGAARLVGYCLWHAAAPALVDTVVALCAERQLAAPVLAHALAQFDKTTATPAEAQFAWALFAAAATVDDSTAWVASLWPLWRGLMHPCVFGFARGLVRCGRWIAAMECLPYTANGFTYCGACQCVGLDGGCPKCGVAGGDPLGRDLFLVQGPWLEVDSAEVVAIKCALLTALAPHPAALEKIQCLVYTLPTYLAHQLPPLDTDEPSALARVAVAVQGPAFDAALTPLRDAAVLPVHLPAPQVTLEPWVPPLEPVAYADAVDEEAVFGSPAQLRRALKRVFLSHPLWRPAVTAYRVDSAEFGVARLRPRLVPYLVLPRPPRIGPPVRSLSEPLGDSTELWQHSRRLAAAAREAEVADVADRAGVLFEAFALLLRPQGNVAGRFVVAAAVISFEPHDASCATKTAEIADVKWALGRRYLLQPSVALELFWWSTRAPWFVAFESVRDCARGYAALRGIALANLAQQQPHLPPAEFFRVHRLVGAATLPAGRAVLEALDATERWQVYEISTLEYLMLVNTAAGRTYNDLNQYFVAPWIASPVDGAPRPLDKPIGALNPARLAQCQARAAALAAELRDTDGAPPPFLYGSHYSTTGSVLYFLLRLSPFTQFARDLQGGKLDHPDRLFHSMAEAWTNVLASTDVKELVPELFYHPGVFTSAAPLGTRQNGDVVQDVVLPAASPRAFVMHHRRALEAAALAPWLDLVFGCKSSGPAAWAADNVFFHLTYAEHAPSVVLRFRPHARPESDPATTQMQYFGQTPPPVFAAPHPPRPPPPTPPPEALLTRVPAPSPVVLIGGAAHHVMSANGVVCARLADADVLVATGHVSLPLSAVVTMDVGPAKTPGRYFAVVDPARGLLGVDIVVGAVVDTPLNAFLPMTQRVLCAAASASRDACAWIDTDAQLHVWATPVLRQLLFPAADCAPPEEKRSLWSALWAPDTALPSRVQLPQRPYRLLGVGDVVATATAVDLAVDLAVAATAGQLHLWALRTVTYLRCIDVAALLARPTIVVRVAVVAPDSHLVVVSATADVAAVDVNGGLLCARSFAPAPVVFAQGVVVAGAPFVIVCLADTLWVYAMGGAGETMRTLRHRATTATITGDALFVGLASGDVLELSVHGLCADATPSTHSYGA